MPICASCGRSPLPAARCGLGRHALRHPRRDAEENARLAADQSLPFQILSDPGRRLRAVWAERSGSPGPAASNQRVALVPSEPRHRTSRCCNGSATGGRTAPPCHGVASAGAIVLTRSPRSAATWSSARPRGTPIKTGADYRGETGDFKIAISDYGRSTGSTAIQDRALQNASTAASAVGEVRC
jgi:hypothetical protein